MVSLPSSSKQRTSMQATSTLQCATLLLCSSSHTCTTQRWRAEDVDLHIRTVQLRARTNQKTTHVVTLDLLSDLMSDVASSKWAHNFDACNDFKPENVLISASTTQEKQTTKESKLICGFIAPDLRFCLQGGGLARLGLAPRIVALFLLRLFLQPQYQFLDECSNFHKSSTIQRILLHLRNQSREILIVEPSQLWNIEAT